MRLALFRLSVLPTLFGLIFALFSPSTVNAADKTLLILGDSLSAGFGIRSDEAWPSLLQRRLETQRRHYSVVNLSISGETTAGGRSRLGAALTRHRPALVVIALGANDGLRGLPLTQMRDNLAAMIDLAQQAGARVLLVGMRLPPNYGPTYVEEFERSFDTLARAKKVACLPFLLAPIASQPALFQSDQLHPTAAAQPLLLDHLWPALLPLLK